MGGDGQLSQPDWRKDECNGGEELLMRWGGSVGIDRALSEARSSASGQPPCEIFDILVKTIQKAI